MIPKIRKLFISYRSSDHREVDYIAEQLRSLKHNDGVQKYETWQDKHDLKGGKSWWDGIVDAIIDCDIFVFHLSSAYLASKVCIAELDYAIERGRPIIPVVLQDSYYIDPRNNKPAIALLEGLPEWLGKYQFIFYHDDDFLNRFEVAVAEYELAWPQDIPARRPRYPGADSLHGSSYEVYATATDHALKVSFDEAKPLFRELVQRNDEDFAEICHQWLTLMNQYQDLLDAKRHRAPRAVFQPKWDEYVALFPLGFIDDLYPESDEYPIIFDPNNLRGQPRQPKPDLPSTTQSIPTKPLEATPLKAKSHSVVTPTKNSSISLMPKPFDWITIPNKGYSIAKYPITNDQFRKFIEADGYSNKSWWTAEGWQKCQAGWHYHDGAWEASGSPWAEPRYWADTKWNSKTQPVVGISWFEAVAFCLWLSEETSENIMLPTEDQWEYTAQGDNKATYPWGDDWDCNRCNNSVQPCYSNVTTSVTQYEGKGDSPFNVVDMAGNIWEWCLTDYDNKTNDINSSAELRILRGGSWDYSDSRSFRTNYRSRYKSFNRYSNRGFRISRS